MILPRLASFLALSTLALSAQATEFSSGFLNTKDKGNIDLSRFSHEGYVPVSYTHLDVYKRQAPR